MVNISYRAARLHGAMMRSFYSRQMRRIVGRPLDQVSKVPLSVYSFSGEPYLPEQVACIRSFISHVGIPITFTIVSDGSYTAASSALLRQINESVKVVDWTIFATDIPPAVRAFAAHNAMGKKLAVLMSMPVTGPAIYTDADILFFPGAAELAHIAESNGSHFWYLPDCLPSLDKTILLNDAEKMDPVNAGFLLLKRPLDWNPALKRLVEYPGKPCSQTEQTIVHLTMHRSFAKALNSERFVLSISDQFVYRDYYADQGIALRHYVNNVRHKFWQSISPRTFRN